MKLLAISDLHLGYEANRKALENLPEHPDDWLIVAGDVGETEAQLKWAWERLTARFQKLLWVPGNHELWTLPNEKAGLRGEARYQRLVSVCRHYGVLTPEDPYPVWGAQGCKLTLAPLFTLYDYSFRPDSVAAHRAVEWARESGIECADEHFLHADPYPSRAAWCAERCRWTEQRLAAISAERPTVLINHFPLRRDLAYLPRIPRFSIWCGTRRTEDWHVRFNAAVVVSGHLHLRGTQWRDGVRFEEVSLGYPHQWRQERGLDACLREILLDPQTGRGIKPSAA